MMSIDDKERLEMMDTLEEILPFDLEFSSVEMICSSDYVMVENFGFHNPVAEAYYNHTKQQVFLYFKFCPIVNCSQKIKFIAHDKHDAMKKTYHLILMIMSDAWLKIPSQDVFKYVSMKKEEFLAKEESKEGAEIERHALGEVG